MTKDISLPKLWKIYAGFYKIYGCSIFFWGGGFPYLLILFSLWVSLALLCLVGLCHLQIKELRALRV